VATRSIALKQARQRPLVWDAVSGAAADRLDAAAEPVAVISLVGRQGRSLAQAAKPFGGGAVSDLARVEDQFQR